MATETQREKISKALPSMNLEGAEHILLMAHRHLAQSGLPKAAAVENFLEEMTIFIDMKQ